MDCILSDAGVPDKIVRNISIESPFVNGDSRMSFVFSWLSPYDTSGLMGFKITAAEVKDVEDEQEFVVFFLNETGPAFRLSSQVNVSLCCFKVSVNIVSFFTMVTETWSSRFCNHCQGKNKHCFITIII